jgi:predicted AAA+ superfamily ATPase
LTCGHITRYNDDMIKMIERTLKSSLEKSRKSLLIVGPRQTGKSTLVGSMNPNSIINFAHEATYLDFLRDPELLEKRIAPLKGKNDIFIDEVQRIARAS